MTIFEKNNNLGEIWIKNIDGEIINSSEYFKNFSNKYKNLSNSLSNEISSKNIKKFKMFKGNKFLLETENFLILENFEFDDETKKIKPLNYFDNSISLSSKSFDYYSDQNQIYIITCSKYQNQIVNFDIFTFSDYLEKKKSISYNLSANNLKFGDVKISYNVETGNFLFSTLYYKNSSNFDIINIKTNKNFDNFSIFYYQ